MRGAKQKEMFETSDLNREILHLRSVCLSPQGVLLYFHTYVGSGYCFGFKILNFNIFGVLLKTEYFCGYEDFRIFLRVITKFDHTLHFRVFAEGQGTESRIFYGLLKFQIFIWSA